MTEREWREASDLRSPLVGAALVVGCAALLRFWNLSRGSPSALEMQVIGPVLQLVQSGSYHPTALTRPTLPIYLYTLVAALQFMAGATSGAWRSVAEFGAEQAAVWGRVMSAAVGTATVFVAYHIGMRWGARHALLGAGLLAVTPAHVAASREVGAGSLLALFGALTLLLSLTAVERQDAKRFWMAGAAAGLAAACDYAGALALVMPLGAVWMTATDTSRAARGVKVLGAALAAFVVATPLAVRDLPVFLDGFAAAASPAVPPGVEPIAILPWLVSAIQWPAMLLALAGSILGVVRAVTGPGHTRWTLLVGFPIVYVSLVGWHGTVSAVTLLPLLAPTVLLAAIAVISGVSQLRRFEIARPVRTALIGALTVAALLPPAVLSVLSLNGTGRQAVNGCEQIECGSASR